MRRRRWPKRAPRSAPTGRTEDRRNGSRMTDPTPRHGSVVITGTSTGIGAATAHHLAGLSFSVFAGSATRGMPKRTALVSRANAADDRHHRCDIDRRGEAVLRDDKVDDRPAHALRSLSPLTQVALTHARGLYLLTLRGLPRQGPAGIVVVQQNRRSQQTGWRGSRRVAVPPAVDQAMNVSLIPRSQSAIGFDVGVTSKNSTGRTGAYRVVRTSRIDRVCLPGGHRGVPR